MRKPEIEPLMTKIGVPDQKPQRRDNPVAPPLPERQPAEKPAPSLPATPRTPTVVLAGR